jgi:hypothetical protein
MATRLRILLGLAVAVTAGGAADLVITSFTSTGSLTWTNAAGAGTYRVEWAGTADGPWQRFEALTPLSSLASTGPVVSVHVPTFYRVVWLDAPPHAGVYRYSASEDGGGVVITGRLTLFAQTNPVTGTWSLSLAGTPEGPIGPQTGDGRLAGEADGSVLRVDLNPGWRDNNVFLDGRREGNVWTGRWSYSTFGGTVNGGRFTADKVADGETP